MDTIDVSNLNRQFLFRQADVGKDKAGVAAAFINKRIEGANVTAHFNKIQDYGPDFYKRETPPLAASGRRLTFSTFCSLFLEHLFKHHAPCWQRSALMSFRYFSFPPTSSVYTVPPPAMNRVQDCRLRPRLDPGASLDQRDAGAPSDSLRLLCESHDPSLDRPRSAHLRLYLLV